MSNIYIHEPATYGKVLLNTTVGDIDVELWSKETPKACRNFIQLCLEGYYDGTIFHRVVKGFIVQGGDPEGTGMGGESIYGEPFKDEFHSRLRFVRRGLIAMANSGKDDNGSQFFFTLGACPELQNKHTVFAKVTGNTLYNMLKLEDSLVDQEDRPVYPHKIISCKVISNPFSDIVPRVTNTAEDKMKDILTREKVKKNFSLLSFGEEAEEEEAETDAIVKVYRGKSKSSHDLTKDPKLSSVSALPLYNEDKSSTSAESQELESIRKKFKKDSDKLPVAEDQGPDMDELPSISEKSAAESNREKVRQEIKQLQRELRKRKRPEKEEEEETEETPEQKDSGNPLLVQFHQEIVQYREKTSKDVNSTGDRQKETLNLLAKFQSKIHQAREKKPKQNEDTHIDSDENDDDDEWLSHELHFEDSEIHIAKDVNVPSTDHFHIHDPRNAMNVRKRQAGKEGKKGSR